MYREAVYRLVLLMPNKARGRLLLMMGVNGSPLASQGGIIFFVIYINANYLFQLMRFSQKL